MSEKDGMRRCKRCGAPTSVDELEKNAEKEAITMGAEWCDGCVERTKRFRKRLRGM